MPDDSKPISGPLFVAVGEDGVRAFSSDGKQWTHSKTGKDGEVLLTACFGGGRCVVGGRFGGSNHFFATGDGLAWEASENDAKYAIFVRNIVYYRDQFLAFIGDSGDKPYILPSADGVHWGEKRLVADNKASHANSLLRRFAIGNDLLVGVGDFGRKCVSRDGIEWKNAPDIKAVDSLIDIAFGNGVFAGGGMHGLRMRSTDGLTWTDRQVGEEGEHINSMLWDGKQFVGVGQGATYTSADAVKWERVPNTNAPTVAAFGGGVYVGSLWQGRLLRSVDAVHWDEVTRLPQHVLALAFGTLGKA
ncbi:MAG TPA: hypothetical protein VFE47_15645 [Tepidisphaeraceae bacterium]|nr:hypothetical protein [Tepidisphaeraceae bacterium]